MVGKADRKVKEFVKKVKREFKIEQAILFGSRARGDYLLHSDYDLILVSPDFRGIFFTKRMVKMYDFWDWPEVLEPFCYTPEEFETKKRQIGIVHQAVKEGVRVG